MNSKYLSIDVGGTLIKYASINRAGQILDESSVQTPKELDSFKSVLTFLNEMYPDVSGVAVSCPGKVDSKEGIIYYGGALQYLHEFNIKEYLSNLFSIPVAIINDGKAAALAEMWNGNLRDIENGGAIVLGTGLGAGLILGHKLYNGRNYQSGEISFLMTRSESVDMNDLAGLKYSPVGMIKRIARTLGLPDETNGFHVFEFINAKDPIAYPIFEEFCVGVASVIYNIQTVVDLERIVIGGGISNQPIVVEEINKQYNHILQSLPLASGMITPVEIMPCHFVNKANLQGAIYQLFLDLDAVEHSN